MRIPIIELSPEELELYKRIHFSQRSGSFSHEDYEISSNAAASLALFLLKRKAVPEIRIRYFTDSALNTTSKKSHKEIFEMNGTSGVNIYKHPHFLPFLHYFIYGPELPELIKDTFSQMVSSQPFISGSDIDDFTKFVRDETRSLELNPKKASEEFYKLALECGFDDYHARMIRNAVHSIRV